MALAVPFRDSEQLVLAGVALLALDEAVRGFGQQRSRAGELAIAGVNFVVIAASNHEVGDTVADFGIPTGVLVEAEIDGGFGRVIPQETVAFVRDDERDPDAGRGGRVVVVPGADRVAAEVEVAFLVLAQAVIVFVVRRDKSSTDLEKG